MVQAIIALASCDSAVGEIFNIGTNEEITITDLAQWIKSLTNSNSEIQFISYDDAYEKGFEDMYRRVPDIGKIRDSVGWAPKTCLDDTLREIIDHLRKEAK